MKRHGVLDTLSHSTPSKFDGEGNKVENPEEYVGTEISASISRKKIARKRERESLGNRTKTSGRTQARHGDTRDVMSPRNVIDLTGI